MEYQQVKKELLDFLEERNKTNLEEPSNCLFLNGPWGIGKTYLLRHEVIPSFVDWVKKKHHGNITESIIYYSLAGKNDFRQIDSEIFWKLDPVMGLRGALKKRKISFGASLGIPPLSLSLSCLAGETDKGQTLTSQSDVPDFLLILDDLERLSNKVALAEVLGLINSIQQLAWSRKDYQSKVIVVCNEEAPFLKDKETEIQFRNFKEKIAAKTVSLTSCNDTCIGKLFGPSFDKYYRLTEEKGLAQNNIRVLERIQARWTDFCLDSPWDETQKEYLFRLFFVIACQVELQDLPLLPEKAPENKVFPKNSDSPEFFLNSRIDAAKKKGEDFSDDEQLRIIEEWFFFYREYFSIDPRLIKSIYRCYKNESPVSSVDISGVPTGESLRIGQLIGECTRKLRNQILLSDKEAQESFDKEIDELKKIKRLDAKEAENAFTLLFWLRERAKNTSPEKIDQYSDALIRLSRNGALDCSESGHFQDMAPGQVDPQDPAYLSMKDCVSKCIAGERYAKALSAINNHNYLALKDESREFDPEIYDILIQNPPFDGEKMKGFLEQEEWYVLGDYLRLFKYCKSPDTFQALKKVFDSMRSDSPQGNKRIDILEDDIHDFEKNALGK